MGQRASERRYALQQYSQIFTKRGFIHIAKMTAIKIPLKEIQKKSKDG